MYISKLNNKWVSFFNKNIRVKDCLTNCLNHKISRQSEDCTKNNESSKCDLEYDLVTLIILEIDDFLQEHGGKENL